MNKSAITRSILTLALPLALTACGDNEANESTSVDQGRASQYIAINSLELSSTDIPALRHPITVAVNAELHGDDYDTELLIGMRTSDREAGCVLGAMPVARTQTADGGDPEAASAFVAEAEFFVSTDCYELAGRDEVELFASFDPWNRLGELPPVPESVEGELPENIDLLSVVTASALTVEGCETCEQTYAVLSSPGLDAQLRELNLSSVVAIVPVEGEAGVEPLPSNRPDFSLTSVARVTGLDRGKGLERGQVQLRHSIRPLGSNDEGLPMQEMYKAAPGELLDVPVDSYGDVTSIASLTMPEGTRAVIADGAWSNHDEFELLTCVETAFDQAIYAGETEPRANDCAALPVVIVRAEVGEDGLPLVDRDEGAAKARDAQTWGGSWGANSSFGFGYSGIDFEVWLDANSSDSAAQTHRGINVYSAGSWFEAGASSTATVFGTNINIVDLYATFIGYEFGGGGVAMGASLFWTDFIDPFQIQLADGVPLTLAQMLAAAGVGSETSLQTEYVIAGVNFDDGCGSVSAGLKVVGTIGIDQDQTSITAKTTQQGVRVSGTVTPYFNLAAVASTTVNYNEYIGGGIEATLDLLNLDVPFTVAVEGIDYSPLNSFRLVINEYAGAVLTTLSGNIKFKINYQIPFPFCLYNCQKSHEHTVATWDGFSTAVDFFNLTQIIHEGSQRTSDSGGWCRHAGSQLFTGDFNGDGALDYLCHDTNDGRKWIDFNSGGSFTGTDFQRAANWCYGGGYELHIGDVNGDGRDDMICHASGGKYIDYADQNGEFWGTDWSTASAWCWGNRLSIGDFNNDGRDDLYCFRNSDGQKWLDYADGSGQFAGTDWQGLGALPQQRSRMRNVAAPSSFATVTNNALASGSGSEWVFEQYNGHYWIRHASNPNIRLHTENGPVAAGGIWDEANSGQWSVIPVAGKPKTFKVLNRHTGTYLRMDNGTISVGSSSGTPAQWVLDVDVLMQ